MAGGDNNANNNANYNSYGSCESLYCNAGWSETLTHMSPYGFANFGIAFGLGLSVVGAAWGIWLTGSSLVGAAVKAPRIRSKNLIRYVWNVKYMIWDVSFTFLIEDCHDLLS